MRRTDAKMNETPNAASLTRRSMLIGSTAALAACGRNNLAGPPTVFGPSGGYPTANISTSNQTAQAPIFFVTDRAMTPEGRFDAERSPVMHYGEQVINLGEPGTTWDDLLNQANGEDIDLPLSVHSIRIDGSLPATPVPFRLDSNGNPRGLPEPTAEYQAAQRRVKASLAQRVAETGTGDVLMFVPGVNTSFDAGATELADVWHQTGRTSVPILYSWPSGRNGVIGYFTDRESGQFTIFHLKEFLKLLAETPGVERIHLLAHSRGSDVSTTALRELIIAERAAGRNPRKTLKVENLILAAPDLNFGVVSQRIIAEQLGPAFGQITAYTNPSDNALALAQRLMIGARFGRLDPNDIPDNIREIFAHVENVNFIRIEKAGSRFGHSYYRQNPDVLSDIVMIVRSCARPGSPQRPLSPINGNFWLLEEGYLSDVRLPVGGCA